MGTETRRATLDRPSDSIWAYFERPQSWPQWDPDIVAVPDDAEPGIVEGRTWNVEMKTPKTGRLEFSDVTVGKGFTWRIVALGGAMQGVGNFRFEPIDDGTKTHFEYEFEMKGVLGKPFWLLARKTVVKGVDGGMSNIIAEFGTR